MSAIDKIKAHYEKIGTRKIHIKEWGLDVFVTPYTVADRIRVYRGDIPEDEVIVQVIIEKAKDEKGDPLFTLADKAVLMQRCDAKVLTRLAREIIDSPTTEELGNS